MTLFAGIDGGQSSTRSVIGDATGRILGRGSAGPADEVGEDAGSTRLHDALRSALQDAIANAGLPPETRFARIVAGISGYEGEIAGALPQLPAAALTIVHDGAVAHAGALGGGPGVVVIAGTGSAAYAVNTPSFSAMTGGWGYVFGDEGSAFWLSREVLSEAMRGEDAGERAEITGAILQFFGVPSLRKLARAFYAGTIARAAIAAFAPEVLREAESGNAAAAAAVKRAANALVTIAARAMKRVDMHEASVAFTGGLTKSAAMLGEIAQSMRELLPRSVMAAPKFDPAAGALLLAYRDAGIAPEITGA